MTTKHQPADAFDGKKSAKNPDAETHPLTPKKKAAAKKATAGKPNLTTAALMAQAQPADA